MRKRIFTNRERALIERFLTGEVTSTDRGWSQLLWRIRHFTELPRDVELYLAVRRKIAEPKTA
jgi:hypothetical protein